MPEGVVTAGEERYGGGEALPVMPVVSVTGPASPVNAVPYTVTWDYSHPNGVPQSQYRVQVLLDDVPLTDTGWVLGSATQHTITDRFGFADTPGAVIRVSVAAENLGYQDADEQVTDLLFGVPTVTWVTPPPADPKVSGSFLTAEWSYADTQGVPQAQYRVQLEFAGQVEYDSGWLIGPDTTHEIPYLLTGGSRYRVGVMVRNANGVESEAPASV